VEVIAGLTRKATRGIAKGSAWEELHGRQGFALIVWGGIAWAIFDEMPH